MIGLNSCDEPFYSDDEVFSLSDDNVPAQVLDYVNANFPDYAQRYTYKDDICDDTAVFEVELEDGPGPDIYLYFDANGAFLFFGKEIRYSALPTAVQAAIEAFGTDYTVDGDDIERWEITPDSIVYEIELESRLNDLEVVFSANGTLICTDSDEHDDDDKGGDNKGGDDDNYSGNIPAEVRDFIQQNYPSYKLDEVYQDDICDKEPYYEVELEDGNGPDLELYFSAEWVFQFKLMEVQRTDLPDAVIGVINTDYADYEIEADDISRLDWSDGRVMFEVELEGDEDDYEIIFNEDGSIYCLDD
jgi:uncharacterized membrane protein YkoI